MAFDAFLKIDGVDGESSDDGHKNWIEILSFHHGVSQPASGSRSSGGAASSERANHQDFSVVKAVDKSSPLLFLHCCNGKHVKEVKLELCRAADKKTKYLEYKLSDVIVSSVRPGGSSQGSETLPLEEITFNYGKIEVLYTATDQKTGAAGGNVKAGWDCNANKAV